MRSRFLCVALLAAGALTTAYAQGAPGANPLTSEAEQAWNRTMHNVIAAAGAMPDAKYSYKPTPESMSFRDMVAHVADSAMGACSMLNGARKTAGAAKMQSKDELLGALKAAQGECAKAYAPDDATAAQMIGGGYGGPHTRLTSLWSNTVHIEHEYAQMAVHLRINGIVPPSTAERPPMPKRAGM